MYYPDGDPIGKPRMIHRQTSYDSVVLKESNEVCRFMGTNETSKDSVVLTKDTGVIRGLTIDSDNRKNREN